MYVRSQSTKGIRSTQTYVVFDQAGTIVHVHSVVTAEGAEQRPRQESERRALELAVERGFDEASLAVVQIDPMQVEPGVRYRVDPASMALREQGRRT